jgi:hypothetical protein
MTKYIQAYSSDENAIYIGLMLHADQQQISSALTLTFRKSLVSFKTDSNKHLHPQNLHIFLLKGYSIESLVNSLFSIQT